MGNVFGWIASRRKKDDLENSEEVLKKRRAFLIFNFVGDKMKKKIMKEKTRTLKLKSEYSMESIKLIYKTCSLHSSTDSEFGMFCLGAAMILRSIFKELQIPGRYEQMGIKINDAGAITILLLDGLDSAKVDLEIALLDKNDNRKLSGEVMNLVEAYQNTKK